MTTRAYGRWKHVAAGVLAIAAAAAQSLVAQGGQQASRGAGGAASARTASLERRLQPARSMLRSLTGTWRFEVRFAGNMDGAPDASGTRVVKALYDDLHVEWTETLDSSAIQGQGIIGFEARTNRFFSTAVYSAGSGAEFLTGVLDQAEPLITFSPISLPAGATRGQQLMQSTALSMVDSSHFTWAALDRSWRAVFTRQPE